MTPVLDTELKTYDQHRDALLGTAEGKCVLIFGDKTVEVYDSEMDAIAQGYREFGNVPFLVKRIVKVESPLNFTSNLLGV